MNFFIVTFLACTVYALACFGTGLLFFKILSRYLRINNAAVSIPVIASLFLIGSGILANIWLIALSCSIFHKWVVFSIVFAGAIYASYYIRVHFTDLKFQTIQLWDYFLSESIIWKAIIFCTLMIAVQTAVASFTPLEPSGDAAAFYMVLPKLWVETQKLSLLGGYEAFMTIGLHGELHFAALMMLGSEWGAKFITWPIGIACTILLTGIAHQTGAGGRGKLITIILVFTSTAFILLIGDGKTDLFGAAMGCAAFYWIFSNEIDSKNIQYFIVGTFSGFAVIAKLSYLPLILPCIILLTFWDHFASNGKDLGIAQKRNFGLGSKYVWLFIGMVIPCIIHFTKNWVLFSEPFAPFFYLGKNPFVDDWANQSWFLPETVAKIIVTYPLALVYGKYPMQYGNLSVLLLAFFPFLFLMPRQKQLLKSKMFQVSVIGMMGIVIWVILRPGVFAPRYILYTLLLLILPVAAAAEHVLKNEQRQRLMSAAIICLCFVYLIGFNGILILKNSERFKDNAARIALQKASYQLNQSVKPDERVISFNYFTYWLRPDLLNSLSNTRENETLSKSSSSEQAWEYLFQRGFRFVLIDQATHQKIAKILDPDQIPEGIAIEEVFSDQNYSVLRMIPLEYKS